MIRELEEGKYYRWDGPNNAPAGWARPMNFMLDGNPHLCIYGNGAAGRFQDDGGMWDWGEIGLYYMVLVEDEGFQNPLNKKIKMGDTVKIISGELGSHKVGYIGKVVKWHPSGPLRVKVNGEDQPYFPSELELVKKEK